MAPVGQTAGGRFFSHFHPIGLPAPEDGTPTGFAVPVNAPKIRQFRLATAIVTPEVRVRLLAVRVKPETLCVCVLGDDGVLDVADIAAECIEASQDTLLEGLAAGVAAGSTQ